MRPLNLATKFLLLFCLLFTDISQSADSFQLFGESENRSKVIQAAFGYYPEKAELRVQLTLENRQVKTGVYSDGQVINHLLTILAKDIDELYCSYKGNDLLAIGKFSNLH